MQPDIPDNPGITREGGIRLKKLAYMLLAFIVFAGCARKLGMVRGLEPERRLVIEEKEGGCAVLRTRICDVAIEQVDTFKWRRLLSQRMLTGGKGSPTETRIPKFTFFHLVVSNVGNLPLVIDSITLHYGAVEKNPIPVEDAVKRSRSPAYRAFDFKKILTARRLVSGRHCLKKIDYERDVVDYRLDFINPGDRLIRIVAFDWVPVQFRELRVTLRVSPLGRSAEKKVIDFKLKRFEYRTRGAYYRKPGKKSGEKKP
jgi:hypothetical protein